MQRKVKIKECMVEGLTAIMGVGYTDVYNKIFNIHLYIKVVFA